MDKDGVKQALKELLKSGELSLTVEAESNDSSHYIKVSLQIDGESYVDELVHLDRDVNND